MGFHFYWYLFYGLAQESINFFCKELNSNYVCDVGHARSLLHVPFLLLPNDPLET